MIIHPSSKITAGEIINLAEDLEALVDIWFALPAKYGQHSRKDPKRPLPKR
jgi:plasmid maintenance system antidote protein VapI